jgi:hypothetical protein
MDPDKEKVVTVLSTGNEAVIALAKSILDDAGIRYFAKNEGVENLIGVGVIGTGFNPVIGPIELQVLEEDAATAKKLLENISEEEK